LRTFDTGATRDSETDKLDYEGFLSPVVLHRYAEYMHTHRIQADGSLRDSDNWQKGIPLAAYMKSLWRHVMDVWGHHRGLGPARSVTDTSLIEDALCAVIFNASGYLHELIKPVQVTQSACACTQFEDIAPVQSGYYGQYATPGKMGGDKWGAK
jgi:hypothetical protein